LILANILCKEDFPVDFITEERKTFSFNVLFVELYKYRSAVGVVYTCLLFVFVLNVTILFCWS
jgi:hypothetical protein